MKLKEEQKAKEAKEVGKNSEVEENTDLGKFVWNTRLCLILIYIFIIETVDTVQESTPSAPENESPSKSLSLKELTALEKEQDSAELLAAMAASCKIQDSVDASQILDPSKLESTPPPVSSTSSEEEGEEKQQPESSAGSSASSRPSVAVSAVNLNVYVPEVKRLTDSELYVLCICLCIIRRERDLIMANRFDATEILKVTFIFYWLRLINGTNLCLHTTALQHTAI